MRGSTTPSRGAGRNRGRRTPDGGQATAELAVAIPSLILVLLIAIWVVSAVSVQAQCAEAARIGARAAARGETDEVVRAWAGRAAPRGSTISISRTADVVVVRIRFGVRATGVLARITPPIDITMSSTAPTEAAENTEVGPVPVPVPDNY
ncbi:TadE family type IV pilus minor pilin [Protofrankia symbiont of Coriaria ruscifolia]|uniref:TadE family type IV pilus minor pilin n=1 Tax=Protofrankia symbiont of Coriaria ruscifolia TaxID=1306542 RepID=UPI0010411E08|nr:TadE family type IV pilus minor pilin [Protofrankia symbiont of Coriaria ruscifolia]